MQACESEDMMMTLTRIRRRRLIAPVGLRVRAKYTQINLFHSVDSCH